MPALSRVTPILRFFDEAHTRAFYVDYLGFTIDWEHRFDDNFPLYLRVSRDDCVLHLSQHYGDCSPGAAIRIDVADLDGYHAALSAMAFRYAKPTIEAMPWGSREMTVRDPASNRLVFVEDEAPDEG